MGDEVWTSDPYGRNFAGMPPGKSRDYAFVQHMINPWLRSPRAWPSSRAYRLNPRACKFAKTFAGK
jgi:hypothetical protein